MTAALAAFYDAIDGLDAARLAFWLGARVPVRTRASWARTLYDQFAAHEAGRKTDALQLYVKTPDAALVVALVDVDATGMASPSWISWLLDRVAAGDDWPKQPAQIPSALQDGRADAVWVLAFVFERPEFASDRLELLRFAQRQFVARPNRPRPMWKRRCAATGTCRR